jgi:hypothetical protein
VIHAVTCAVCGTPPPETVACGGGHLLCPRCLVRCERCGARTCRRCVRSVVEAGAVCYDATSLESDRRVTCPACA